ISRTGRSVGSTALSPSSTGSCSAPRTKRSGSARSCAQCTPRSPVPDTGRSTRNCSAGWPPPCTSPRRPPTSGSWGTSRTRRKTRCMRVRQCSPRPWDVRRSTGRPPAPSSPATGRRRSLRCGSPQQPGPWPATCCTLLLVCCVPRPASKGLWLPGCCRPDCATSSAWPGMRAATAASTGCARWCGRCIRGFRSGSAPRCGTVSCGISAAGRRRTGCTTVPAGGGLPPRRGPGSVLDGLPCGWARRSPQHGMLTSMDSTSVPPLTVIVGDEELLVDRAVAEVVAAVRATDPEVDVHDLMPSQVSAGKLVEVTSPSLFGDRRVVVLRSAQDLTKEPAGVITDYVKDPVDDVVLVLVHAGGAKGKALLQAALQAGAHRIDCAKPTKASERI